MSNTDTMTPLGAYIVLDLLNLPGRKTGVWIVRNKKNLAKIGKIEWYGPWRQYVFETHNTIFNADFLRSITDFLDQINS